MSNGTRQRVALQIRIIRVVAVILFAIGLAIFLDIGNLATKWGLVEAEIDQIIGPVFMVIAVMDMVLVPRMLEKMSNWKQDK